MMWCTCTGKHHVMQSDVHIVTSDRLGPHTPSCGAMYGRCLLRLREMGTQEVAFNAILNPPSCIGLLGSPRRGLSLEAPFGGKLLENWITKDWCIIILGILIGGIGETMTIPSSGVPAFWRKGFSLEGYLGFWASKLAHLYLWALLELLEMADLEALPKT